MTREEIGAHVVKAAVAHLTPEERKIRAAEIEVQEAEYVLRRATKQRDQLQEQVDAARERYNKAKEGVEP